MNKHIVLHIMLLLLVTVQINGMEQTSPCYLALMPCEIHDRIAYFLMCDDETEEEFITRTKNIKQAYQGYSAQRYYDLCNNPNQEKYIFALNCDKTKIAIVIYSHVTLFDTRTNEQLATLELKEHDYKCIALSPSGTMIATFSTQESSPASNFCRTRIGCLLSHTFLSIYKINHQKTLIIQHQSSVDPRTLPPTPTMLCFNRQGTHLNKYFENENSNEIIHLHPDVTKRCMGERPTLKNYFEQKYVCKTIENSTQQSQG